MLQSAVGKRLEAEDRLAWTAFYMDELQRHERVQERGDGMSSMIRCDKCKKMMYADSRSDKGDWCTVRIDYVDGLSTLHLCKVCHRQFLVEFVRTMKPEEYDDQFGSWWEDEVME